MGSYTYGARGYGCGRRAGPHAVSSVSSRSGGKNTTYCYDANGNNVSGDGRTLTYTSFDLPSRIVRGANVVSMAYGADRQLIYRDDTSVVKGVTTRTQTHVLGSVERVSHLVGPSAGKIEMRYRVGGVLITQSAGGSEGEDTRHRYTHVDHLGSVVAITDELGEVAERLSFDAWGRRRAVLSVDLVAPVPGFYGHTALALSSGLISDGFTGHQQLDGVGIIHMRGRIYDAELGRFLQGDPLVQDATNLQSLNRYSYVQNNPLSYTDPSGFVLQWLLRKAESFLKRVGDAAVDVVVEVGRVVASMPRAIRVVGTIACTIAGPACWANYTFVMMALNASAAF